MNSKLILTKTGFVVYKFNEEERDKYIIKKKNKKYHIMTKVGRDIVKTFDSHDAAQDSFYEKHNTNFLLPYLEDGIFNLEEGVNFCDIINAIEHSDFGILTESHVGLGQYNPNLADKEVVLNIYGRIEDGKISFEYNFFYEGMAQTKLDLTTKIKFGTIKIDGCEEAQYNFCMLDLIYACYPLIKRQVLTLKKDGLYDCFSFKISEKETCSPTNFLFETVVIEDDVTLEDIFKFVEDNPNLKAVIGPASVCNIDIFHAEASKAPEKIEGLLYLGLSKVAYFSNYQERLFNYGITFHGYELASKDNEWNGRYGIEFSPVNEIKHLPVKLEEMVEIRDKARNLSSKLVRKVKVEYSLYEILRGIYWEISFLGTPNDRNEMLEEVDEAINSYLNKKEPQDDKS